MTQFTNSNKPPEPIRGTEEHEGHTGLPIHSVTHSVPHSITQSVTQGCNFFPPLALTSTIQNFCTEL